MLLVSTLNFLAYLYETMFNQFIFSFIYLRSLKLFCHERNPLQTYRKSSIKPPGGAYLILDLQGGGLINREGTY